jgi:hypothetical protein
MAFFDRVVTIMHAPHVTASPVKSYIDPRGGPMASSQIAKSQLDTSYVKPQPPWFSLWPRPSLR